MLRVGIDLGTTFSAVAWVNPETGRAEVISTAQGDATTPSVVCFDGRQAWIGRGAELRKDTHPHDVYENVKRHMGTHRVAAPGVSAGMIEAYEIGGYAWGAVGLSALILRKLKRDALRHFRKVGLLDSLAPEADVVIEAVITVPASFGDVERQATVRAGLAAGLTVTGIVNEPTAAAIANGVAQDRPSRLLIFDLGGGTCDVTILEGRLRDKPRVLATVGDNTLGGREWDAVIQRHLSDTYLDCHGHDLPADRFYEVQRRAIAAKHALTDAESTTVELDFDEGRLAVDLHRSRPGALGEYDSDGHFYFDDRASPLLLRCRTLCEDALRAGTVETGGFKRPLEWGDIDEVILAGGSCRMPMIPATIEEMAGRSRVRRQRADFNYDTAIAIGAALSGHNRGQIRDVMSHTIGVVVSDHRGRYVLPMIEKNTELPAERQKSFPARERTSVDIVEVPHAAGDTIVRPEDGRLWGQLPLDNPSAEAEVRLVFRVDENNVISVSASYPPDVHRELTLQPVGYDGEDLPGLRERVLAARIHE